MFSALFEVIMEGFLQILKILSGPLIGAVIGYFTNYIAVKMLFRPHYPKKIGKCTLPFTPGIIPKRKPALAKAIGKAVGENLLTGEDIVSLFSSEETEGKIVALVSEGISSAPEDLSIESLFKEVVEEEKVVRSKEALSDFLTERVASAAEEMNLGGIVREKGKALFEKKKASLGMLGMFLSPAMIDNALYSVEEEVNRTVSEEGKALLYPAVSKEVDKLFASPFKESLGKLPSEQTEAIVRTLYRKLIESQAPKLLSVLNVSSVVEDKVNAMDVKELEKLCLSVMKKELNAIVNLGALIGFLLGILNIFL